MMPIGIRPTVDFAFKRLFGSPEHTAVTLHFLNAVLGGDPWISAVELMNSEQPRATDEEKMSILDVLARDNHGRQINIEMQTTVHDAMAQRLLYYATGLFVRGISPGDNYDVLRPAITICLLAETLFPQSAKGHLEFRLRDPKCGLELSDCLQIHTLELPKFSVSDDNVAGRSALEKWAYFLNRAETLTAAELVERLVEREFGEATEVLEMISQTPAERALYEARQKALRDEAARLEHARKTGLAEGRTEGLHEGLQEGLAKGQLVGQIRLLQQLLGLQVAAIDELSPQDDAVLERLAVDLQNQWGRSGGR